MLKFENILVAEGLVFKDISSEIYRKYIWAGDVQWTIANPIALRVSESGGHYIIDNKGEVTYIPTGWIALNWCNDAESNHVDF